MNEPPEFIADRGDDPMLDELLSHLKRIEPPLDSRVRNRMAVAAELSSLLAARRPNHLPWWRRSISISVPTAAGLAASFVVLAGFAVQSSFRRGEEQSPIAAAAHNQPAEHAAVAASDTVAIAKRAREAHPVLEYHETATYLCGIGRLNSESGYFLTRRKTDD